jgi:hypothetical protein
MPYIVALLGLIGAAYFWASRVRNAGYMAQDLADMAGDVMGAARRIGFRGRANVHPVESIDDPAIAIAALGTAFMELGGLPTQEQRDALSAALQRHARRSATDAEEEMILGRWLVSECKGAEAAIARLARRLCKLDRVGSFEPLMWVLNDVGVAARGGMLSEGQKDALAEIARTFKLS